MQTNKKNNGSDKASAHANVNPATARKFPDVRNEPRMGAQGQAYRMEGDGNGGSGDGNGDRKIFPEGIFGGITDEDEKSAPKKDGNDVSVGKLKRPFSNEEIGEMWEFIESSLVLINNTGTEKLILSENGTRVADALIDYCIAVESPDLILDLFKLLQNSSVFAVQTRTHGTLKVDKTKDWVSGAIFSVFSNWVSGRDYTEELVKKYISILGDENLYSTSQLERVYLQSDLRNLLAIKEGRNHLHSLRSNGLNEIIAEYWKDEVKRRVGE